MKREDFLLLVNDCQYGPLIIEEYGRMEAELAEKDEEIARLRKALGIIPELGHDDECLFCARKDLYAHEALKRKEETKE